MYISKALNVKMLQSTEIRQCLQIV